ncbi:n/a [Ectocarpus siliculosus]|uniref:N/a n=1 Tax=Ectocarpus siliculosus TaxID=2880 RepID=D7FZV9_ECTSI|nr:n/a [Ectocarpus siliculosus]|eukprot:CBJ48584.1 n/a [Ectocarpus siliculosus]
MGPKTREGYRGLVAPTSNNEGLGEEHCSRPRNDRGNGVGRPPQARKQRRGNRQGKGTGPVKIWCCPSTSALREEACANLNAMTRPRLWREQAQRSEKLDAGYRQLERLRESYKSDRERGVAGGKRRFLSLLREEMSEDQRERWMKRRALMRADRFTVGQRRELREWFDCLDKDGSGEIDSSELSHPLLCTGLARSALEVGRLVRQVDKDGSGEIGFHEFLAILQPKGATAGKSAIDKITHLQDVKKAHGSDMQTVVAIERRSLLMKEILDEAAFRSSALDDVEEKRCGRFQRQRDPCGQGG